ncbi:MAG: hypothetical protein WAM91_05870 [Candidatus Acidiferrales bacterium]
MMIAFLYHLSRLVAGCQGALLIYAGLFLKEDEERKVQNLLVKAWSLIDDAEKAAISSQTAFMRTVAQLTTRALQRVFGEKLFSVRSLGVSVCLSMASLSFMLAITWLRNLNTGAQQNSKPNAMIVSGALVCVILAAISTRIRSRPLFLLWFFSVLMVSYMLFDYLFLRGTFNLPSILGVEETQPTTAKAMFAVALIGGAVFDLLFIAATRFVLLRIPMMKGFLSIVLTVLANLLLALLCILAPILVMNGFPLLGWTIRDVIGMLILYSNLIDFLVACAFLIFAAIMVLHRIFWPFIERPLYALDKFGVIKRPRLLVSVGLLLVGFGLGLKFQALASLYKLIT